MTILRSAYRTWVLAVARLLGFIYVRRYVIEGQEHVPREGAVIVASNHLNNADPPFVARAMRRPPIFMAKKQMLEMPIFGLAFRAWGAFPVRRGEADLSALRKARELLQSGEMLLMFPEGTRSRTAKLTKGHPGTALVALRTGAPVLPVAVTGTEGIRWPWFFMKPQSVREIKVVIGEPFRLEPPAKIDGAAAKVATETIMRNIAALLPPEYRGVYGDDAPSPAAATAEAPPAGA